MDDRLTSNDDLTLERIYRAREGQIGANCEYEEKHTKAENKYHGPGTEAIKSSFRPYPYLKPKNTLDKKTTKPAQNFPGPGQYAQNLKVAGPQYQFGSRFDDKREAPTHVRADGTRFNSSLRTKPHLKPQKVDGPGPGDYAAPDSVVTKKRDRGSA